MRSRGVEILIEGYGWNHCDTAASDYPTEHVCPSRIHVTFVSQRFVTQKSVHYDKLLQKQLKQRHSYSEAFYFQSHNMKYLCRVAYKLINFMVHHNLMGSSLATARDRSMTI